MPGPRPLHRRTAVLGLAATFLVAGCDHGDDIGAPSSPSASASGSATTSTAAEPEQTPDQALVDEVDARLAAALAVLLQSRKAPGLARALRPLIQAHRRHVAVLEGDAGPTAPPGPAQQPGPALEAVVGSERGLRDALVDAAGRAESGALAKLLASMAASTAQHLAALPKKAR